MSDPSQSPTPAGCCPVHPEQAAVGVCMSCGRLICADCRRRLAGRNICPRCLADDETSSKRRRRIVGLVALALIGLGLGLWISRPPNLTPNAERLIEVSRALETFRSDMLRWPGEPTPDEADVTIDTTVNGVEPDPLSPVHGSRHLGELLRRPPDAVSWFGPYLDEEHVVEGLPADVYGNPLAYYNDERGILIASPGPDGVFQTDLAALTIDDEPEGDDLLAWVRTGPRDETPRE